MIRIGVYDLFLQKLYLSKNFNAIKIDTCFLIRVTNLGRQKCGFESARRNYAKVTSSNQRILQNVATKKKVITRHKMSRFVL